MWQARPSFLQQQASIVLRCLGLGVFVLSSIFLPVIFFLQMYMLDQVFLEEPFEEYSVVILAVFFPFEALLFLHMIRHSIHIMLGRPPEQTVRAGSLHWTIYCWVLASKYCIIYFHKAELRRIIWVSPIFYCVLAFKALRHFFAASDAGRSNSSAKAAAIQRATRSSSSDGDMGVVAQPSTSAKATKQSRQQQERHATNQGNIALDVVLLQDMVWHVVMDMIDINYMMYMSNAEPESNGLADEAMRQQFPEAVENARIATGIFITLALFFHQQSFPTWVSAPNLEKDDTSGGGHASASGGEAGGSNQVKGNNVDVIKARKRSAVVSILLVDIPFVVIRTFLWSLSMRTHGDASAISRPDSPSIAEMFPSQFNSTEDLLTYYLWPGGNGGIQTQTHLDKWWVKNILCLLLQAMQLRFVQQADMERSQSLSWWDRSRAEKGSRSQMRRVLKGSHLKDLWHELSEQEREDDKLQAAFDAHGLSPQPSEGVVAANVVEEEGSRSNFRGGRQQPPALTANVEEEAGEDSAADREEEVVERSLEATGNSDSQISAGMMSEDDDSDDEDEETSRRHCCCCSVRRRRSSRGSGGYSCRVCNFDCSQAVFLHGIVGFTLGWLLAKVDFSQTFTELKHAVMIPATL